MNFLDIFIMYFLFLFYFYFIFNNYSFLMNFLIFKLRFFTGSYIFSSSFAFFIFFFIMVSSFSGFFSYSYCVLSLISFTFFFSFYLWLTSFVYFINNYKFSVYLVKNGDSYTKTLFMLLVEIVSEFSRPFSLTVRLTVNIMVGHLFCLVLFNIYEFSMNLIFLSMLPIIMEFFVFIIQSYIFSRLIFLYLND